MSSLHPEVLVVKGGTMNRKSVAANIDLVRRELKRPGTCVMVWIDHEWALSDLVPNKQLCLSTPALLAECGVRPDLEATNDLGNRYQYTLWLPDEDTDTLVDALATAFRGPFPKKDVSDEWTTADLRGLQCPQP